MESHGDRATGDRILIRDLRLRTIIGINDWEREKAQEVLVNLVVFADVRRAGASDRIEDALNYRTLTKEVIGYVEDSSHYLLESLATEIARIAVVGHGAAGVVVRVEKPGALRFARSVGVEIERRPSDFAPEREDG